jgi:ABC-type transporter Mla maintaining outer membrane lipid asymmetry permease subunit MlaE
MSDAWTMTVSRDEVRAIIQETLAEQNHQQSSDAAIMKTIATILTSFGIEDDDRKEIRADFQHLRRWRKSVEQAQSYTFKTVIAVIVSGLLGAMWLGFKALAGK